MTKIRKITAIIICCAIMFTGSAMIIGNADCIKSRSDTAYSLLFAKQFTVIRNILKKFNINFELPALDSDDEGSGDEFGNGNNSDTEKVTDSEKDSNYENKDNESSTAEKSKVRAFEEDVVALVNEIRIENGLSTLKINEELITLAEKKSQDMCDNNYFAHESPTYGSAFDMMKKAGVSYRNAGENIAKGYLTPEAVVDAWMNSSGHRANILSAKFTQIGVGYVADGNYWTQMFIG